MPFAKYTNSEKSKGEVATCPSRVPPLPLLASRTPTIRPSYPGENIQIATLSQCERRTSAEPLRSDSMGIDIQIYLTEVPLPSTLPCPPFYCTLIFSLSFPFSSTFAFFPRRKPLHRNRCKLPGVGKGTGKKEFASRSLFFSPSTVDTRGLNLERKPRRQMRASARGNCSSLIFRAAFPSPEDLDLEKKRRCRLTRFFDANKSLEADTMGAPIFIEMRYGKLPNW